MHNDEELREGQRSVAYNGADETECQGKTFLSTSIKVQLQLGGVNCSVDLKMPDQHVFAEPTIVIGIAVNNAMSQGTHVSRPSSKKNPRLKIITFIFCSAVGIAFSTDPKVARFNLVCARSHDGKSVNDMDVVMMKVLKAFHKHTKDKPKLGYFWLNFEIMSFFPVKLSKYSEQVFRT